MRYGEYEDLGSDGGLALHFETRRHVLPPGRVPISRTHRRARGWSVSEDCLNSGLDDPVGDYLRRQADQFAEQFATRPNPGGRGRERRWGPGSTPRTSAWSPRRAPMTTSWSHHRQADLALMDDRLWASIRLVRRTGGHGPADAAAVRQIRRDRPLRPDPRPLDPPARPAIFGGTGRILVYGISVSGRRTGRTPAVDATVADYRAAAAGLKGSPRTRPRAAGSSPSQREVHSSAGPPASDIGRDTADATQYRLQMIVRVL